MEVAFTNFHDMDKTKKVMGHWKWKNSLLSCCRTDGICCSRYRYRVSGEHMFCRWYGLNIYFTIRFIVTFLDHFGV